MKDKILIVDDDPVIRKLTARMLKITGFSVEPLVFKDGSEAFEFLKLEAPSEIRYIIFLDINMPKMNGWEFLQHIEKENFKFDKIIYLITSSVDQEDHDRALSNKQVSSIITKPFTLVKMASLKAVL
ncbi:response regulator [Mariniflexile sp. AS56]|uniref:response regulator n=1 Tax=Mariniflexile sp. AS56 TaxID=3063957 RepID=UPI0026EDE0C1|nr:response regulator [Mariniflexile sp. AS56]MDO7173269.1 response regulator [Mariniflexile sp. AS56]